MLHKFAKDLGFKTNEDFYKKFPTEQSYFGYLKSNGQANVEQNQTLKSSGSAPESLEFTNVKTESKPLMKKGGKVPCKECEQSKMQMGGTPKTDWGYAQPLANNSNPSYQQFGSMYQMDNWSGLHNNPNQFAGFEGMGNSSNLLQNPGNQPVYSDIKGYQNTTSGPADGTSNYSIDRVREEMKKGGHWIQGAIKHLGRCTKGSPNYDCPKGSPQWNLAQRFRHGDLHKKQEGGMTLPDDGNTMFNRGQLGRNPQSISNTDIATGMNSSNIQNDPNALYYTQKPQSDIPGVTGDYASPTQHPFQMGEAQQANMKQGVNPWMVGAAAIGAGVGAFAGYSSIKSGLDKQKDFANYRRNQGLSSNAYAHHNPTGAQGDYGQVGQGYGMYGIGQMTPATGGNRVAAYGGRIEGTMTPTGRIARGTWDGDLGQYFQMGGSPDQGLQVGQVLDLSPEQIQQLSKQGYKFAKA